MDEARPGPVTADEYDCIAAAIHWIDLHAAEQPTSADIAAAAGLSEAHFARMFRRWAGIAPGRYLRHRTHLVAAAALDRGASVLDAALDSGLSGPGRLHDLLVSIDAMSPGEYKSGGAGLALEFGIGGTPFGDALIVAGRRGIVELDFVEADRGDAQLATIRQRWHAATFTPLADAQGLIDRVFFGGADRLVLNPAGTNFQIKVWRALLGVAAGDTTHYSRIAAAIGQPSAARAVGNAVAANPIAFLIPCHRVLRAGGSLGGYRWGQPRKQTMLAWEACRSL